MRRSIISASCAFHPTTEKGRSTTGTNLGTRYIVDLLVQASILSKCAEHRAQPYAGAGGDRIRAGRNRARADEIQHRANYTLAACFAALPPAVSLFSPGYPRCAWLLWSVPSRPQSSCERLLAKSIDTIVAKFSQVETDCNPRSVRGELYEAGSASDLRIAAVRAATRVYSARRAGADNADEFRTWLQSTRSQPMAALIRSQVWTCRVRDRTILSLFAIMGFHQNRRGRGFQLYVIVFRRRVILIALVLQTAETLLGVVNLIFLPDAAGKLSGSAFQCGRARHSWQSPC